MNKMVQFLLLMMKGCLIGIANIIPGVSGGTIAVAMNIYTPLVGALSRFPGNLKNPRLLMQDLIFLLPVLTGAGAGIIIFSKIVSFLLMNYPVHSRLFFAGLIIGSLPLLFKLGNFKRLRIADILSFISAAAIIIVFFILDNQNPDKSSTLSAFGNDNLTNPLYLLKLAICGFFAAAAMVVPGVSGSLLLVMLGVYGHILAMISCLIGSSSIDLSWHLSVLGLTVFSLGIAFGIIFCARLIDYLMKKYPQASAAFILGLMIFSILPVWPFGEITLTMLSGIIYSSVILSGAAAAYMLSRFS